MKVDRRPPDSTSGRAEQARAVDPLLASAYSALAKGDFRGAAGALRESVKTVPDSAAAHELLGGLCLGALDDYPLARRHLRISYRLYRAGLELHAAARAAVELAQVETTSGNRAEARGWLGRAKRLIDDIGPCVEEGYYRIAVMGCEVPDVVELEASAARALEIARIFHDTNLEVRALAESGLALISQGRTGEGLIRLDEALMAVTSGEIGDFVTCGLTCCAMVSACSLLGDIDRLNRLIASLKRMAGERFGGFESPILTSHCHTNYGGMLIDAGRWQEAEVELDRAIETSASAGHRAAALAGLAELRIHQNRTTEAAQLLRGLEDRLETAPAQARLYEARNELDLASAMLRWALQEQRGNLVLAAPLLAQLVEVECRRNVDAAQESESRLDSIAARLPSSGLRALALLSRARVQRARGENPIPALQAAFQELGEDERPRLRGEIHAALADAERHRDTSAATTQARAALAIFDRIGARRDADRAAALLRTLGVSARAGSDPGGQRGLDQLSRREREVVPLLAEGLSNAEIGRRLFVTPKTVEHHVTSILGKLGLRTRTEVGAWAHQGRTAP